MDSVSAHAASSRFRQGDAADIYELLRFAIFNLEEQRDHPILALGELFTDEMNSVDQYAPYIGEYGVNRTLDLYWTGYGGWGSQWCFGAVPARK